MARRGFNLERLNYKIRRIPEVVKQAIREALEESAELLVAEMKRLVPRDSGALAESIGWTFGSPPKGSISLGTIDEREAQGLRVTIYAGSDKAYYARWQEFGTVNHPAQPFFYVSYRKMKRGIKSRISRRINKALKGLGV